jgi:trehalose 6-phosphate synthase
VFDHAYNAVANRTLWFVHHLLYNTPTRPEFGTGFRRHWEDFRRYNAAFADALAAQAAPGARVLVQDYHLSLVPAMLRERRPDVRIAHFSHTPWAPPDYFCLLPDDIAREVLAGLLGADSVGFLTQRWAAAFRACCRSVLGLADDAPLPDGRRVEVRVHPLGVDAAGLRQRAAQPDVEARLATMRAALGERKLVLRVDRTELSKNIVRGLHAYRELLRSEPSWRERVVHLAFAYPSRHDLPEYREYTGAVQRAAAQINDEFATAGWRPVMLEVSDDYPRSLAAMRLADVLVTNPIRDGMNLVAKEGPVLSDAGLALVLSREAGAAAELGPDSFVVNPFDVSATATAMHEALLLDPAERSARCGRLAAAAAARPPSRWLADQLEALA